MSGVITWSSSLWNVEGAEYRPKSITLNSYKPLPETVKVVSGLLASVNGTCQ